MEHKVFFAGCTSRAMRDIDIRVFCRVDFSKWSFIEMSGYRSRLVDAGWSFAYHTPTCISIASHFESIVIYFGLWIALPHHLSGRP